MVKAGVCKTPIGGSNPPVASNLTHLSHVRCPRPAVVGFASPYPAPARHPARILKITRIRPPAFVIIKPGLYEPAPTFIIIGRLYRGRQRSGIIVIGRSGRARLPCQTAGLHLPKQRNLRRHRQHLGLRPPRRRAQAQYQRRLVARIRMGARRYGRAGFVHPDAPRRLARQRPRR